MADHAICATASADECCHDDSRQIGHETAENDHFVDVTEMTDGEILLRDWCGES